MSLREITVQHPNGRSVRALVLGNPECGRVVLYHHGFPACRLEALLARKYTAELGISVVAIDRPGLGESDFYPGRTLGDWPQDVSLVMDTLGVPDFAVLAVSGGTPSAVTLAARLPHRVKSLTVVSGIAPMQLAGALDGANRLNRFMMQLGYRRPRAARRAVQGIAHLWKRIPVVPHLWLAALLPSYDRQVLLSRAVGGILGKSLKEALSKGTLGVVTEFELMTSPWEAELDAIKVPTTIWHGNGDTYVPCAMGRILHERVGGSVFKEVPDAGHFMIVPMLREILAEMVSGTWSGRDVGAA